LVSEKKGGQTATKEERLSYLKNTRREKRKKRPPPPEDENTVCGIPENRNSHRKLEGPLVRSGRRGAGITAQGLFGRKRGQDRAVGGKTIIAWELKGNCLLYRGRKKKTAHQDGERTMTKRIK